MADDPTAALRALLASRGIDDHYPEPVHAQVRAWLAAPGIDDGALEDRTALPFVTVDGVGTRDLDQALYVERRGSGHAVQYAIADAAWFVPVGTPLFDEALRRGASYYLPGESVPMLPRPLSEGLVSLAPGVDRRAMVFDMTLDAQGRCTQTRIVRARIRSRHQLSFAQVGAVLAGQGGHPVSEASVVESLRCLAVVGQQRAADAAARGVVPYHRTEVRVKPTPGVDARLTAVEVVRNDVEAYNAQLSLLCNAEGARVLRDHVGEGTDAQPIYKVHPEPSEESLDELAARINATVDAHGLDETWRWDRGADSLADYVRRLPADRGAGLRARVSAAITRQSIMVNVRSAFAVEPAPHHGVGAEVYGRFSAPMREVVGVFLHKEMWEALAGEPADVERDEALRQQVVDAANRSRTLQRELTLLADRLVIDALFAADLPLPPVQRRHHAGTVMGIAKGRVYVRLDDPPLDVKVYTDKLDRGYRCDDLGSALWRGHQRICRLGDPVALKVVSRTRKDPRWLLDIAD